MGSEGTGKDRGENARGGGKKQVADRLDTKGKMLIHSDMLL